MKLVFISLCLGQMIITSYRSVPKQTDNSPYYTSIGEHVHPHGIAVSQDLLWKNGGPLHYGDLVYIEDIGFKIVNDCMATRHRNRADVWVKTYDDEVQFNNKFKSRKLKIWLVKSTITD